MDHLIGADGLGGGEVEAAGEHREPVEQELFAVRDEVVGPGDDGLQGLMALDPSGGAQQPEAVIEVGQQVGRSE